MQPEEVSIKEVDMKRRSLTELITSSENYVIAAAPIAATCVAFAEKAGRHHFYDIPFSFIRIDIISIIISLFALGTVFFVFYALLDLIIDILSRGNPYLKLLRVPAAIGLFGAGLMVLTPGERDISSWILLLMIAALFIDTQIEKAQQGADKLKPLKERLQEYFEKESNVARPKTHPVKEAIAIIMVVGYVSFIRGYGDESEKIAHLTIDEFPQAVVAVIHDEKILLKQYDPVTKKISDDLIIFPVDTSKSITLRSEDIGTLISANAPVDKSKKVIKPQN